MPSFDARICLPVTCDGHLSLFVTFCEKVHGTVQSPLIQNCWSFAEKIDKKVRGCQAYLAKEQAFSKERDSILLHASCLLLCFYWSRTHQNNFQQHSIHQFTLTKTDHTCFGHVFGCSDALISQT